MSLYIRETLIQAPQDVVFGFHERPDALPLLIPPWEKVTVEVPPKSLEKGTLYSLETLLSRVYGLPKQEITADVKIEQPLFND